MKYKKKFNDQDIEGALKYTEDIINVAHDPLIILYEDLTVALASSSFYEVFKVNPEKTEGKFIYDLGNGQWDIPKLRKLLEEILPKTTSFDDYEIEHHFPFIGRRTVLLNARRIYLQANQTKLIIITIKDITERKMIDELGAKIKKLEEQLRKNARSKH